MKEIACYFYVLMLGVLLVACGEPNQRLDEQVFYDGPQFRLKVVRYYRNIPFNYLGEHAVVMCQSDNTGDYSGHDRQDAGWRMLGEADARGSKHARDVAPGLQDDYLVFDDHTLVGKKNVFNISFDACGHFINWDPTRLPQDMVEVAQRPDSCAPDGPLDCRYYDFEGVRKPQYEQISVAGPGQVSFRVRATAFREVQSLHVETRNNGALWHVDMVKPDTGGHELQPGTARSLSVSLLEAGMDDVSLVDWFESVLPPGSMVIWPDGLAACGEPQGDGAPIHSPLCAEIRFNDSKGNSGALTVSMATDAEHAPGKASFHSAVYTTAGRERPVGSLAGLRESVAAGAQ